MALGYKILRENVLEEFLFKYVVDTSFHLFCGSFTEIYLKPEVLLNIYKKKMSLPRFLLRKLTDSRVVLPLESSKIFPEFYSFEFIEI